MSAEVGAQDAYEDEADQVATEVMAGVTGGAPPTPPPDAGPWSDTLPSAGLTSGGSPLPAPVRSFYEERFGTDFSDVRIHRDAASDASCRSIGAHAFSYDNHVHLSADAPVAPSFVLAHELAHVVQQRPEPARQRAVRAFKRERPRPRAVLYWTLRGSSRPMRGSLIHETVGLHRGQPGVRAEVHIPNGNLQTARQDAPDALSGQRGRADYYRGVPVGVYWLHDPLSVHTCANGPLGKPARLPNPVRESGPVTKTVWRGSGSARQKETTIELGKASPNGTLELGELKPASLQLVELGLKQLAAYERGIGFAAEQANCHWQARGSSTRWHPTVKPLTGLPRTVRTPRGADGWELCIGEWVDDTTTRIQFDPKRIGMDVRGVIDTVEYGNGVYVYIVRPTDPKAVLEGIAPGYGNSALYKERVQSATTLQDEVIDELKKPPSQRKLRPLRYRRLRGAPRRVRAKRSLKDDFDLPKWERKFQEVRDQWRPARGVAGPTTEASSADPRTLLEFVDKLYEAERNTDAIVDKAKGGVPLASSRRLPQGNAKPHVTTRGRKPTRIGADRLFDWFETWTHPATRKLGALRARFGGAFVRVATHFDNLRLRLAEKLHGRTRSTDTSWGGVAVRAMWSAAATLGRDLFDRTSGMLVDGLESGLKKRLSELLPYDDLAALRADAERDFPWIAPVQARIDALHASVQARIEQLVAGFYEILEPIEEVARKARKWGGYIKWANRVLQCGTPPIVGCWKLLFTRLAQEAVERILQWCPVREKFAGLVSGSDFVQKLPAQIAHRVADEVEGLLPERFVPVFERSGFASKVKPRFSCSQSSGDAAALALSELEESLGTEKLGLLLEAAERFGVPARTRLDVDTIQRLGEAVQSAGVTTHELKRYLLEAPSPGRRATVEEFLVWVRRGARQQTVAMARIGIALTSHLPGTKRANPGTWQVERMDFEELARGEARAKIVSFKVDSERWAAGSADLQIHRDTVDCTSSTVEVTFTRVELYLEDGTRFDSPLEGARVRRPLPPMPSVACSNLRIVLKGS